MSSLQAAAKLSQTSETYNNKFPHQDKILLHFCPTTANTSCGSPTP